MKLKIKELQANRPQKVTVTPEERVRRHEINIQFAKKHKLTEAETRQLIDQQLRNAGWEVDTERLNNWQKSNTATKGS